MAVMSQTRAPVGGLTIAKISVVVSDGGRK
jgi:hypothetical protein